MTVEWVVYACPKCGIQHDQGDECYGMPTNRHDPVAVERVVIGPWLVRYALLDAEISR